MRPTTGLKDMFFELDPGTSRRRRVSRRARRSRSRTPPPTSTSTRSSRRSTPTPRPTCGCCWSAPARGSTGATRDLGELLGSLGPINRDLAKLNREVAKRQENLARLIHNFNLLTTRSARPRHDLTELVSASNGALGAIAEQDPNVQRAVALLPGTLEQATETLDHDRRASPTCSARPSTTCARSRATSPSSTPRPASLAESATPVLERRDPAVRARGAQAGPRPAQGRRRASREATPRLTAVAEKLNRLGNMAAFNPNGAEPAGTAGRDEGYLYWAALARPQRQQRLLGRRRQRLLPPDLPHGRLRPAAQHRRRRAAPPSSRSHEIVTGFTGADPRAPLCP